MKKKESGFVHLHVHSEYSLLDGLESCESLIERAKELNMDSLADLIDNDYDSIGKAMEILAEQMGGNTGKKQKAKK